MRTAGYAWYIGKMNTFPAPPQHACWVLRGRHPCESQQEVLIIVIGVVDLIAGGGYLLGERIFSAGPNWPMPPIIWTMPCGKMQEDALQKAKANGAPKADIERMEKQLKDMQQLKLDFKNLPMAPSMPNGTVLTAFGIFLLVLGGSGHRRRRRPFHGQGAHLRLDRRHPPDWSGNRELPDSLVRILEHSRPDRRHLRRASRACCSIRRVDGLVAGMMTTWTTIGLAAVRGGMRKRMRMIAPFAVVSAQRRKRTPTGPAAAAPPQRTKAVRNAPAAVPLPPKKRRKRKGPAAVVPPPMRMTRKNGPVAAARPSLMVWWRGTGWHALRYSEGRGGFPRSSGSATPFGVPQGVPPEKWPVYFCATSKRVHAA